MSEQAAKHMWIIYDGRATSGNTDDAAVYEACESRRDLKKALYTWRNGDGVVYEYDVEPTKKLAANITNGRYIGRVKEGRRTILERIARAPVEMQ